LVLPLLLNSYSSFQNSVFIHNPLVLSSQIIQGSLKVWLFWLQAMNLRCLWLDDALNIMLWTCYFSSASFEWVTCW
jgi:hypothetical protein